MNCRPSAAARAPSARLSPAFKLPAPGEVGHSRHTQGPNQISPSLARAKGPVAAILTEPNDRTVMPYQSPPPHTLVQTLFGRYSNQQEDLARSALLFFTRILARSLTHHVRGACLPECRLPLVLSCSLCPLAADLACWQGLDRARGLRHRAHDSPLDPIAPHRSSATAAGRRSCRRHPWPLLSELARLVDLPLCLPSATVCVDRCNKRSGCCRCEDIIMIPSTYLELAVAAFMADAANLLTFRHSNVDTKACIVLTHGFSEHTGRYYHVFRALTQSGFVLVPTTPAMMASRLTTWCTPPPATDITCIHWITRVMVEGTACGASVTERYTRLILVWRAATEIERTLRTLSTTLMT